MKLVMLTTQQTVPLDELRAEFPQVTFEAPTTPEERLTAVVDADALYGIPSRELFRAAKKVRWVHCPGTGVDAIWAVPELVDSDVVLTNTRGPHAAAMADHVFAQLL